MGHDAGEEHLGIAQGFFVGCLGEKTKAGEGKN